LARWRVEAEALQTRLVGAVPPRRLAEVEEERDRAIQEAEGLRRSLRASASTAAAAGPVAEVVEERTRELAAEVERLRERLRGSVPEREHTAAIAQAAGAAVAAERQLAEAVVRVRAAEGGLAAAAAASAGRLREVEARAEAAVREGERLRLCLSAAVPWDAGGSGGAGAGGGSGFSGMDGLAGLAAEVERVVRAAGVMVPLGELVAARAEAEACRRAADRAIPAEQHRILQARPHRNSSVVACFA
jgi:hypothetical protein